MTMQLWTCPKCTKTIEANAVEVTHRCPGDRNRVVAFVGDRSMAKVRPADV